MLIGLRGLVTECDLVLAEDEFPGVGALYRALQDADDAPQTFLDLLVRYGVFSSEPPSRRESPPPID